MYTSPRKRKRFGEFICHCSAYEFPHRMFGGVCSGSTWVDDYFSKQLYRECRDCHFREVDEETQEISCQVLNGLEPIHNCPGIQDFIHYEGIHHPLLKKRKGNKI